MILASASLLILALFRVEFEEVGDDFRFGRVGRKAVGGKHARIVAVTEHGLARELRTVVPHLVLNVGQLRIVLVVLLVLRAVNRRVQRSFHG